MFWPVKQWISPAVVIRCPESKATQKNAAVIHMVGLFLCSALLVQVHGILLSLNNHLGKVYYFSICLAFLKTVNLGDIQSQQNKTT